MKKGVLLAGILVIVAIVGCTKVDTSPDFVASISFDSLPYPSVVLGDVTRDSTGAQSNARAFAYNYSGDVITDAPIRYYALDRGITIDSVTGAIRGDSLRATSARIVASVKGLQSGPRTIDIILKPDTVARANTTLAYDSLLYSISDTTKNLSVPLQVKVYSQDILTNLSPVKSYLVSFAIIGVGDTLATLVNDAGKESKVDTTDSDGIAGRRIKLRPIRLTSATDSVIVRATVKYLGAQIKGSPVRLVLKVKPGS